MNSNKAHPLHVKREHCVFRGINLPLHFVFPTSVGAKPNFFHVTDKWMNFFINWGANEHRYRDRILNIKIDLATRQSPKSALSYSLEVIICE